MPSKRSSNGAGGEFAKARRQHAVTTTPRAVSAVSLPEICRAISVTFPEWLHAINNPSGKRPGYGRTACTRKRLRKISIQMISLIALSRLTAMETKQSKRKEQQ
jgi:hypothetical protein